MWMTDYIRAVKRGFRDQHGFKPKVGSSDNDPVFENVPDGEYPMLIDGQVDQIRIINGKISCCNFKQAA